MSIARSTVQLFYLILIIFTVSNNFAILALQYYPDKFSIDSDRADDQAKNACDTLARCIINIFNVSFQHTPGTGVLLNESLTPNGDNEFGLVIFNLFNFTIIPLLLLAALFGIVVDNYSSYNENFQNHKEDKKSKCFICGITKDKYE